MSKAKHIVFCNSLAFLLAIISHNTLAACTRADITGTWKIYSHLENYGTTWDEGVISCHLNMPGSGQALSSNSVCSHYIYSATSIVKPLLTGSLTIDAACHVVGTVKIGDQQRKIDAWISKGKDSISGMMWNPTVKGHDLSEILSGIKL